MSRVPLREALKILEGEGAVTYVPHRGYFVARALAGGPRGGLPDPRAARGGGRPRGRAPADRDLDLEAPGRPGRRRASRPVERGDVEAMTAANRALHFALYEASQRPRLVRLVRILWDATDVYRSLYYARGREPGPRRRPSTGRCWPRCAAATPTRRAAAGRAPRPRRGAHPGGAAPDPDPDPDRDRGGAGAVSGRRRSRSAPGR